MKICYLILGWFFVIIGVIGAFLPVLPTTVFMILALWAFSKSSERFHDWLYQHKLFGPPLQRWKQYHVIPLQAKILAISMMSISFAYIVFFRTIGVVWISLTAILMLYAMWFILTKPSSIK